MTALDKMLAKADEVLTGRFPYNDASNRERDLARALKAVAEVLNVDGPTTFEAVRAAIERRLVKP